MTAHKTRTQLTGSSLIEVLVALLVISVGLLGVAKTQALSLGNTKTASSRSIASIHAASFASAMHANKLYWAAGLAPATVTVTGAASSPSNTVISNTTIAAYTTDCVAGTCTPVEMAAYDLRHWGRDMALHLPSAQGTVTCSMLVGVVNCTVQVQWAETYIGLVAAASGAQQIATQTYTLLVQP